MPGKSSTLKLKGRHRMRGKDIKHVKSWVMEYWGVEIPYTDLDQARYGEYEIILRNNTPLLFLHDDKIWFPTIFFLLERPETKRKVTIDMGGVRAVSSGANVMAPGVVACDDRVEKGEGVWVAEERYGRALAVGIALMDPEEMVEGRRGVAVKNIHHVGDKIWEVRED